MKIINLFAEPSGGKSTTMFGLTYYMKTMGLSVDCTPEYFKELVYENRHSLGKFGGQLSVLAEQNRRLEVLRGQVDYVVTDCPLPLIGFYTPKDYVSGFDHMVRQLFDKYDNHNFMLERRHVFEDKNRAHDEQAALQIAKDLPVYLNDSFDINPIKIKTSDEPVEKILKHLISKKIIVVDNENKIKNLGLK